MKKVLDLAFEEFGEAGNPPLVILHGFLASSRNWRQTAKNLASQFHVFVPDQRNHGASPHDSIMDYPAMAEDLLAFLETQGIGPAILLGHSMGGKVAMWFSLRYPAYVSRLVVVDIAPVAYQHSFDGILQALKRLPLDRVGNRKQADDLLSDKIPEQNFRQFLLQNLVLQNNQYRWRIDLDIFCRTAANIIGFPDSERVPPFCGETLFIAGESSSYLKEEVVTPLFPESSVVTIAGAGHWVHVERPDDFLHLVEAFCCQGS
ncbi:MAG: alpha/beta fold hydrolase [Gammaproteobacteria bacterium]